jgi:hypothetical protein
MGCYLIISFSPYSLKGLMYLCKRSALVLSNVLPVMSLVSNVFPELCYY